MREAALDDLGSASLQLLALLATGPALVLVDSLAPSFGLVVPATLPRVAAWCDIRADVALTEPSQRLGLVVALVGDDLGDAALVVG